MFVRLLGPVELVDDAGPVRLGGEKERTALAAMAAARGRPVDGDQLVAALWDEDPPRTAVKSMHTYVSRLRSVVGDAITRTSGGYVLHVEVDVVAAERLVTAGHRHLGRGDAERAAECFFEALDVWTGPSLAGVAATHAMESERARLDEFARTTAEHRIDALLECGGHSDLVGELEVMVGLEPLRERRWAQLLTALYRSGRQSEALRAYQRLRTVLADELGIDPSGELQDLEHRILVRDPSLDVRPGRFRRSVHDPLRSDADPSTTSDVAVPLPARLVQPTPWFTGRRAELSRLHGAWDRAVTHGRRGVVVAGEPGIGKSALVDRFAQAVHAAGASVVVGECSDDLGVAHRPWIELLTPLVEHLSIDVLAEHVQTCGGVLSRMVPAIGRRIDLPTSVDVDPETERYLLFGAVVDLLSRAPGPLLVVIDDLHWADGSSMRLFRHVMASPTLPDVLVVGTYRPTDVDAEDPLPSVLAELRQVDGVEFLSLEGLDDAELLDLVTNTLHELPDEGVGLRDALTAETGGNPFFCLEILRHLAETGALAPGIGGSTPDGPRRLGLPVSVRQVVGQRIARLGGTTHRVLREAAVIGRTFELDALAAVADIDADELLELLDAAVAAAVVTNSDGDHFHFAHALIEHALYAELLPARRVRTHARVASWLEERSGDDPGDRVSELAHHWAEAVPVAGPDRAIEWARRAGDHAMQHLAPDEAVRWYSSALDLLDLLDTGSDGGEMRPVLHLGLGCAERQVGAPVHRQRLLDAARLAHEAGDVDVLVDAALANNSGIYSAVGQVDHERVAVLEVALAELGDTADQARARVLATLSAELTFGGSSRAHELAADAVTAARRCDDADTLCDVLTLTEVTRRVPWMIDERDRCTSEALELTADGTDPFRRFYAAHKRHHVSMVRAERVETRRYLAEAESIADRFGLPHLQWVVRRDRVLDAVLDGDLGLAERRATAAHEADIAAGQHDASTRYAAQLMAIRRQQGRLGELVPAISRLVSEKPDVAAFRAALANAHVGAGRLDRAGPVFAELTTDLDRVAADPLWSTHMGLLVDTAIALRELDVAADLYERLLPYGDQISTVVGIVCDGAIAHRLGRLADLLGQRDDAVDHLTEALGLHRRLESPLHVAATELELVRLTA